MSLRIWKSIKVAKRLLGVKGCIVFKTLCLSVFVFLSVLFIPATSHAHPDNWIQQAAFAQAVVLLENYTKMMEEEHARSGSYESTCFLVEELLRYFDLDYAHLYKPAYRINFIAQNLALGAIKEKYCSK